MFVGNIFRELDVRRAGLFFFRQAAIQLGQGCGRRDEQRKAIGKRRLGLERRRPSGLGQAALAGGLMVLMGIIQGSLLNYLILIIYF